MQTTKVNLKKAIKDEARKYLDEVSQHDLDHSKRVRNLALHIGKIEGGDALVLEIASILHDIGRIEEFESKGEICHAKRGAELAKEILDKYDIPEKKKENIIHCIAVHRLRKSDKPKTLEAKILFDADKIDSLGAVGIGRLFHFAGQYGSRLINSKGVEIEKTEEYTKEDTAYREFKLKLRKVKDRLFTKEGKRIAIERHDFMESFFARFWSEIKGKV